MSSHITKRKIFCCKYRSKIFVNEIFYLGIASISERASGDVSIRPRRIPKVLLQSTPHVCPLREFGLSNSVVARRMKASVAAVGNPLTQVGSWPSVSYECSRPSTYTLNRITLTILNDLTFYMGAI